MELKKILSLCKTRFSLIESNDNRNIDIKAVQIITSINQISLPGSICIILKFDKNIQIDPSCHYLIPADYISYNFKNSVTLYNSQNFLELTLFLQDILTDKETYFNTTSIISSYLNSHSSLQEICQYISVLFNKPAVFVDELFNAVALYPKEKTGIEPYDIFIDSDYRNVDTSKAEANVSEMLYPDILKSALTAFKPYKTACASCPIYSGGKYVGGFAMFSPDNDIDQTDLKIIDYTMMLIGNRYIISDEKNSISFNSFYRSLVTGNYSEETLVKNASILNIDLCAKYHTIVISTKSIHNTADSIIPDIKKYLNTELCGIFDNNYVFSIRENNLTEDKKTYLLNKAKEKDDCICIFDIPIIITKTNTAYNLARKYLNNSICSNHYYRIVFENYETFSGDNISNLLFYNELKTLKKEEYETIREYLYSGQNSIVAADKLNIHRNTLAYRLEKIANIIQIDYSSQKQLFNLFLTLKLMD